MKLLAIVFIIIGSTDISVDCYDFKQGEVSYSTNIIHPNPQHPDKEAQSAFSVNYGSSPSFPQQQKNPLYQIYQNQNQYAQPSQAFNVGYSVSFTNGAPSKPKQTFPDIVLGSHKEQVIKPSYTQNQLPGFEAKPSSTSWPTLGFGKEMFHSPNVNLDGANPIEHTSNVLNLEDPSIPRSFDHAKALGGSQGFDYTDVLGVNPILQFNQKYNRQIPEGLKTPQTLNYPPVNNVPVGMKDNVVSLGNLPGTNIIISDNLEAKYVPENVVKLQKQTNPNHQETVETFTVSPKSYENLNSKFRLIQPNFPLRPYQSPSSDLTPSYSQYSPQGAASDQTPSYSQYSSQGPASDLTPSYSQYSSQGPASDMTPSYSQYSPQGPSSDLTPSYSQYSPQYITREVQKPDFGFVPPSQNQLYKNYRTYDQPHRYYSKNLDHSRIKHFNLKSKFARGIKASMQPPNHRSLPRRKRIHSTRQIN